MRLVREVTRGLAVVLLFTAAASADRVDFKFDVSLQPMYNGGEIIPWEVYVEIVDSEGNGRDSQGLASFVMDIVSNTGISTGPAAFSRTRTTGPAGTTIISPKWQLNPVYPYTPFNIGGFGMNGISDTGNATSQPGNILGVGASIPLTWDSDIDHAFPGLQPNSMHNIGWLPTGTPDVGGTPIPSQRSRWYLARGTTQAPAAPGFYDVSIGGTEVLNANLISRTADLNFDITGAGLVIPSPNNTGGSFRFQVIPEPATLSALLLAGAGLVIRRRR